MVIRIVPPLIFFFLSIFQLGLPGIADAQNEIESERSSLQGINELGFTVNLEVNATLNEQGEIEITSLREAIRQQLEESNIPIVDEKTVRSSADIPFLYVHVNTMDAGRGLIPFSISVRFYQPVKLSLNRDRQTSASTWETGTVGLVSYDRMNVIQESVRNLVGDFIRDFKSINN